MKTKMLSFPDKVVDVGHVVQGCPHLHKLHIEGRINKLPNHQDFSPYLAKLTLWGSRLVEDPMPILEKLPYLRVLSRGGARGGRGEASAPPDLPKNSFNIGV